MYGVVQGVDHVGRLAKVTWFHTYILGQEMEPHQLETVQLSVYDLKDHPDFQYRPGTVAMRIANFDPNKHGACVGQVRFCIKVTSPLGQGVVRHCRQ